MKRFSPTSESTWKRFIMESHRTTVKKKKKSKEKKNKEDGTHFNEM